VAFTTTTKDDEEHRKIDVCLTYGQTEGNAPNQYDCETVWGPTSVLEFPNQPCCGAQFELTAEIDPYDPDAGTPAGGSVTSESSLDPEYEIDCPDGNCSLIFGTGEPGDDACAGSLNVELTATPLTIGSTLMSTFTGWTGGDCDGKDDNPCDTSAKESPTVIAHFNWSQSNFLKVTVIGDKKKDYAWIFDPRSDFDDPAQQYCTDICYEIVPPGTCITIKRKGGKFGSWGGACSGVPNSADQCEVCFSDPATPKEVIVNFIN
jgi:hypothetical protein